MKIERNDIINILNFIKTTNTVEDVERPQLLDAVKEIEPFIIDLDKDKVSQLLECSLKSNEEKAEYYDKLVATMSWDEIEQLMKISTNNIAMAANERVRSAKLLINITATTIKVIPIILMFL